MFDLLLLLLLFFSLLPRPSPSKHNAKPQTSASCQTLLQLELFSDNFSSIHLSVFRSSPAASSLFQFAPLLERFSSILPLSLSSFSFYLALPSFLLLLLSASLPDNPLAISCLFSLPHLSPSFYYQPSHITPARLVVQRGAY